MPHIYTADFQGNPSVGLFAYATDQYCLVGASVPEKNVEEIKDALGVPVHRMTIAGTSLLGVFCAGNANMLLIPSIAFDHEKEELQQLNIPFTVIETKLTALGNNIVANDLAALIHPDFEPEVQQQLPTLLGTPVRAGVIEEQPTVGSCLLLTGKAGIIHKDAPDEFIDELSEYFGVAIDVGTVNRGVPQVHSGIIANSNGLIVGSLSSGVEVTNADEVLGFLGDGDE